MKTYTITKADIDNDGRYVGCLNLNEGIHGHLSIEPSLGIVRFASNVIVSGSITTAIGSGIKADWNISAGHVIEADLNIEADWSIKADWSIESGNDIKAGSGIKAGYGVTAGNAIVAGWGIEAGLSIISKTISSGLRIFAGLATWKIPESHEMQIRAKLLKGTIAYGELVEPEND